MAEAHKFMFDVDFDEPETPPPEMVEIEESEIEPEPVIPPAPTFSEEELAAAREDAYAAGRDQGVRDAMQTDEHRIADAVEVLSRGFRDLSSAQEKANETTARLAVALAVTMTRKLLPETARRHGSEEVAAVVAKVMPHILEQPRVFVRVPPDLVEPLRSGLTEIADSNGYEGRLLLVADETMGPADCRIEWADGAAERSLARVWRGIGEAIVNNGGEMPPEDLSELDRIPDEEPAAPEDEVLDEAIDEAFLDVAGLRDVGGPRDAGGTDPAEDVAALFDDEPTGGGT
ncbi:MAG: hypothetical protein HQL34_02275 [Alphaproteobacteria bacterium]|nr:hypothetical protein [Alphaproteobacteria bacterium]